MMTSFSTSSVTLHHYGWDFLLGHTSWTYPIPLHHTNFNVLMMSLSIESNLSFRSLMGLLKEKGICKGRLEPEAENLCPTQHLNEPVFHHTPRMKLCSNAWNVLFNIMYFKSGSEEMKKVETKEIWKMNTAWTYKSPLSLPGERADQYIKSQKPFQNIFERCKLKSWTVPALPCSVGVNAAVIKCLPKISGKRRSCITQHFHHVI